MCDKTLCLGAGVAVLARDAAMDQEVLGEVGAL